MIRPVSEHGIIGYDLTGNWCEKCGRAKSFRLWPGGLTGCATCDEVVTRHRCTKRPDLDVGQSWTCPDCDSVWTAREEEETCGECGQGIGRMRKTWDSVPGDRIDSAPRYKPEPWTPFRNIFTRQAPSRPEECYRTPGGIMVHVEPGCRCKQ